MHVRWSPPRVCLIELPVPENVAGSVASHVRADHPELDPIGAVAAVLPASVAGSLRGML